MAAGLWVPRLRHIQGTSLLDLLFVLCCIGVLTAIAVPALLSSLETSRGVAAARYIAAQMAIARVQAVNRSANVAVVFEWADGDVQFSIVADGNANGVRVADIGAGTDIRIQGPARLTDSFSRVDIVLGDGSSGVDADVTTIMSFSPFGTSSSGTIRLRDGGGTTWGVRVLGATGRTRIMRWSAAQNDWIEAF